MWWRRDLLGTTSSQECGGEYTTVNSRKTVTTTLTHLCSSLWTGWCLVAVCRFSHCSRKGNIIFMLNPRLQVIGVSHEYPTSVTEYPTSVTEYPTSVTTLCSSAESKLICHCQRNMLDFFTHIMKWQSNRQYVQRKINPFPLTKL